MSNAPDFTSLVAAQAAAWSGIEPPNAVAEELAAAFAATADGFRALRGSLAFEDEPASFLAALVETKERL